MAASKRANRFVSKESAKSVLKKNKLAGVLTAIVGISVLLYVQISVIPAVDNVYDAFKYEKPLMFVLAPYFILIGILIEIGFVLYILFSKSIEHEFEEKLLSYKDEERIKVRELSGRRLNLVLIFIIGLSGLILAVSVLLSVYMLKWRIQQKYQVGPNIENQLSTKKDCVPTSQDVEGPYFRPNAPVRASIAPPDAKGERLIISGTVYRSDCKTPLANAAIDIWHADSAGKYDNSSPNYWYRGQLITNSQGHYQFETVRSGNYREGNGFRPAHIHFRVTVPGYRQLTTQLYFKDDPYLGANDSCVPCKSEDPSLIIELEEVSDDLDIPPVWYGTFNIVLEPIEPQSLNTTNWQTYRNEGPSLLGATEPQGEFGFEFRYPKRWKVQETSPGVLELKNSEEQIHISIRSVDASVRGISYCEAHPYDIPRCEQNVVDGFYGTIDWQISESEVNVLFDDMSITLVVRPPMSIDSAIKSFFRNFLSTFRFID